MDTRPTIARTFIGDRDITDTGAAAKQTAQPNDYGSFFADTEYSLTSTRPAPTAISNPATSLASIEIGATSR
ncbi:MAG: hypothetical protein LZF86_100255 [Nitrospira sp.]|nr:MAG: hypothetical protein LZF86_100255 [Nitrospira sp.]